MIKRDKPIKVHEPYRPRKKSYCIAHAAGITVFAGMCTAYCLAGGHAGIAVIVGAAAGLMVYSLAALAAG